METITVPAKHPELYWGFGSWGNKPYNVYPQPDGTWQHIAPTKSGGYIIYKGTLAELDPVIRASVSAYRARYRQPHIDPHGAQIEHAEWLRTHKEKPQPIDTKKIIGAITIPPD